MDHSVKLFVITFGLCGLLMLWITFNPPKGWIQKTAFLISFVIIFGWGLVETSQQARETAEKQALASIRHETFFIPLSNLIYRAENSIRDASSYRGLDVIERAHRPRAREWYGEVAEFLERKCSDKMMRNFTNPATDNPATMEFPTDHLRTTDQLIHFYNIRVGILKEIRDNASLCEK